MKPTSGIYQARAGNWVFWYHRYGGKVQMASTYHTKTAAKAVLKRWRATQKPTP